MQTFVESPMKKARLIPVTGIERALDQERRTENRCGLRTHIRWMGTPAGHSEWLTETRVGEMVFHQSPSANTAASGEMVSGALL